jgi:hypothetical protein
MDTGTALDTIGPIMMAVREEMIRLEEQHSCILTSAILTEVLHRKGYQSAYTLRVRVRIVNRAFKDYVQRYGPPNTPDAMARCDAAGAAMIGLGEGPAEAMPEGRWPGHTVVIIPGVISDGHLMSDATITQVNRPELQIELQPFVAAVQDAFVKGERPFREELNGCLLSYTALPGDREHEATELWTSKLGIALVVDMVMSRL